MIHLDLQPEIESELAAEAEARGLALDRYIEPSSLLAPTIRNRCNHWTKRNSPATSSRDFAR